MSDSPVVQLMADAAATFLASLDDTQASAARFGVEDEEARRDWHYIPRPRRGLAFAAMSSVQEKAAYDLLSTGLAVQAFAAVTTVIGLEDVLDRIESGRGPRRGRPPSWGRHRADYSTSVFGDPAGDAPWGWRFEGHHVSVNVTVADGEVSSTPLFLGSNPAEVTTSSGHAVTRPLAAEEDVFLDLVATLGPVHRGAAHLGDAPDDIVSGASIEVPVPLEPRGVPIGAMGAEAAAVAESLARLYVERAASETAAKNWDRLAPHLVDVHFAWAGQAARRRPQYYRLQGQGFVVEYDNTQDGANHVHTVVRDPAGDFGDDLLREHRARHHH